MPTQALSAERIGRHDIAVTQARKTGASPTYMQPSLQPLSENLVIVGVSYRHVPVATLGQHALPRHELTTRLPEIAKAIGATELAYIGTCNRLTFVIVGAESPELYRDRLSEMNGLRFRAWQGEGAMEHLLLVASGLESARRGEPEIRNQVRGAWAMARDAGTSGPVLNRLFAEVLKAASEVQSFVARSIGVVSLTDGALGRLNAHLQGKSATVAVIGVSPMTRRCAVDLIGRGHRLIVASRTLATAQGLTNEIGGTATTLEDLRRRIPCRRSGRAAGETVRARATERQLVARGTIFGALLSER